MKIVNREVCDHCGHVTNTIRRDVHSEMVGTLRRIMTIADDQLARGESAVVSSDDIFPRTKKDARPKRSTDAIYLRHWHLVRQPGRGLWEITPLGRKFLCGQSLIPSWKDFRRGAVIKESKTLIGIDDVRKARM